MEEVITKANNFTKLENLPQKDVLIFVKRLKIIHEQGISKQDGKYFLEGAYVYSIYGNENQTYINGVIKTASDIFVYNVLFNFKHLLNRKRLPSKEKTVTKDEFDKALEKQCEIIKNKYMGLYKLYIKKIEKLKRQGRKRIYERNKASIQNRIEVPNIYVHKLTNLLGNIGARIFNYIESKGEPLFIPEVTAKWGDIEITDLPDTPQVYNPKGFENMSAGDLYKLSINNFPGEIFECLLPKKEFVEKLIKTNGRIYHLYSDFETSIINENTIHEFGYVHHWEISNHMLGIKVSGSGIKCWVDALIYIVIYYRIFNVKFYNLKYDAKFFMPYLLLKSTKYIEAGATIRSTQDNIYATTFNIENGERNEPIEIKIEDIMNLVAAGTSLAMVANKIVAPTMDIEPSLFNEPLKNLAKSKGEYSYRARPLGWRPTLLEEEYMQSDTAIEEAFIISYKYLTGIDKLELTLAGNSKKGIMLLANAQMFYIAVQHGFVTLEEAERTFTKYRKALKISETFLTFPVDSIESYINYLTSSKNIEMQERYLDGVTFTELLEDNIKNEKLKALIKENIVSGNQDEKIKELFGTYHTNNKNKIKKKMMALGYNEKDAELAEKYYRIAYYEYKGGIKSRSPCKNITDSGFLQFKRLTGLITGKFIFNNSKDIKKPFYNIYTEQSVEADSFLRKTYQGGISHVNAMHASKVITEMVACLDRNSMYPANLVYEEQPIGSGRKIENCIMKKDKTHLTYFMKVRVTNKKPIKFHVSPILNKQYFKESKKYYYNHTFKTFKNQDIYYIPYIVYKYLQSRRVTFEILELWEYDTAKVFAIPMALIYCSRKEDIKNDNKTTAQTKKIYLNGFYGKTGEKLYHMIQYAYIDILDSEKYNGALRVNYTNEYLEEDKNEETVYKLQAIKNEDWESDYLLEEKGKYGVNVAIASNVTAGGRLQLCRINDAVGYNHVYAGDTDSVRLSYDGLERAKREGKLDFITFDGDKLGGWENEGNVIESMFFRPKCYLKKKENGEIEITMAGFHAPEIVEEKEDAYNRIKHYVKLGSHGSVEFTHQKSRVTTGGKVIYQSDFKFTGNTNSNYEIKEYTIDYNLLIEINDKTSMLLNNQCYFRDNYIMQVADENMEFYQFSLNTALGQSITLIFSTETEDTVSSSYNESLNKGGDLKFFSKDDLKTINNLVKELVFKIKGG